MKRVYLILFALLFSGVITANNPEKIDYKKNFITGTPEVKSINALTFGPDGILFIGDSKTATVVAFDTKDTEARNAEDVAVKKIDQVIADALGAQIEEISIQDMAVNPISKNIYLAVHHENGTPVLLKMQNGKPEPVSLNNISYSSVSLNDPIATDAKDRRGREQRVWAVSDLSYFNDQVMVSGLSNKEFSSTFRSIQFPFTDKQMQSSLEIYHAAHGRYETYAPIKAFTAANIGGKDQLIASYTCTPLVLFPLNELQPSEHVKGRTVAELGNWNTPLDMIVMEKDGKSYLLMANSSRALMKFKFEDLAQYDGSLTQRVGESAATAGVDFINLPFVNVQQLDKLGNDKFVFIQRKSNGDLDIVTQSNRWL
ncbi:MAG: hypothetical protein WBA74_19210 [Cyclobacteriaceae bacterium]